MMRTTESEKIRKAQNNLLPRKGSSLRGGDAQRDFLTKARDNDWDFCKVIRKWGLQGRDEPPVPNGQWSEKEFVDPPSCTESIIVDTWKNLTPAEASREETWFSINLTMIEKGVIKSSYLAGESSRDTTGRDFISDALRGNDSDKVDRCVRRILRRLGGVMERGRRTVYLDCPLARAWWRHRYACETNESFEHNVGDLSDLLRKKPIWNEMIPAMTSYLTLIGDSNIRPSLISFLERNLSEASEKKEFKIKDLILQIGRRSEIQALGSLPPQQVFEIIRNDIFPLLQQEHTV